MDIMKTQIIDGKAIYSDNDIRPGRAIHGCGTVTRTWNHPDEYVPPDKRMCSGCRDDRYNDHSPHGVKECWMFKSATVCNKVGHSSIHRMNGPDVLMVKTLDCWHAVIK